MSETQYQHAEAEGWIYKISSDGSKSASFKNIGQIGKQMWAEYQTWIANGNETLAKWEEPEDEKKARLLNDLTTQRNFLLKESDCLMLSDFPDGDSQEIKDYRQSLRDMPTNHTTIEELENPTWPEKP